jgi:hypothetical protein
MRAFHVLPQVGSEHLDVVAAHAMRALSEVGFSHRESEPEFARTVWLNGDHVARIWRQPIANSLIFDLYAPFDEPTLDDVPMLRAVFDAARAAGSVDLESCVTSAELDLETQTRFFPPSHDILLRSPYDEERMAAQLRRWGFGNSGTSWKARTPGGWELFVELRENQIRTKASAFSPEQA